MTATLSAPAAKRPRSKSSAINPLQLSRVVFALFLALVAGVAGLSYVSLKNAQHALGDEVRRTERQLRETRARNQDYQSRIASLSSRMALRRKLDSGFIAMVQIPATAIARLTPPAVAGEDGPLRTAAVVNPLPRP